MLGEAKGGHQNLHEILPSHAIQERDEVALPYLEDRGGFHEWQGATFLIGTAIVKDALDQALGLQENVAIKWRG